MSQASLSCRYLPQFVETVMDEVGRGALAEVLRKAGMPGEWADPDHARIVRGIETARAYAGIQRALRTYYGRGARGTLMRTGRNLWDRLMQAAPLVLKIRAGYVRALPVRARPGLALGILAGLLGSRHGEVTVHPLDLDLLLSDRASPGTLDQSEAHPICYVTLGMSHACLQWATGVEYDIEETSCRARGEEACEFKITSGGG